MWKVETLSLLFVPPAKGGGMEINMRVGDLKNYIFDKVVLYKENPEVDGEYIDIHKGFICTLPTSILNLEVRTIGAKRKGVVDIRVK